MELVELCEPMAESFAYFCIKSNWEVFETEVISLASMLPGSHLRGNDRGVWG